MKLLPASDSPCNKGVFTPKGTTVGLDSAAPKAISSRMSGLVFVEGRGG